MDTTREIFGPDRVAGRNVSTTGIELIPHNGAEAFATKALADVGQILSTFDKPEPDQSGVEKLEAVRGGIAQIKSYGAQLKERSALTFVPEKEKPLQEIAHSQRKAIQKIGDILDEAAAEESTSMLGTRTDLWLIARLAEEGLEGVITQDLMQVD
jgi:hypothetical protein